MISELSKRWLRAPSRRAVIAWLLAPMIAWAAVVTAEQVAAAIRSSATASPWLKAHAAEIGALAIRVESGGNTQAYNGSCCYGVLQLSRSNILASGMQVDAYRDASLQTQVDAWAGVQSQAMLDPVIQQLQNRSTFDGQPVDAAMLISCVQLGQGNCRRMVNSGRCNGFEDSLGTDICEMAARTRAAMNGTPPPTNGGANPNAGVGAPHNGTQGGGPIGGDPIGGVSPNTSVSPDAAFEQGSRLSMGQVSSAIKLMAAGLALIWLAWTASSSWGLFIRGRAYLPELTHTIGRATVVTLMVIWLLN